MEEQAVQAQDDNNFYFRLEDIIVTNFSIALHPAIDPDSGRVSAEFGFDFSFDFDNELTTCTIHFRYLFAMDPSNLEKKTRIMHIDIGYIFSVLSLRKFVYEKDGKSMLETGLLLNIINLSYSSSRGVIFERTRGYGLNRILLPALNVEEYLKTIGLRPESISTPTL